MPNTRRAFPVVALVGLTLLAAMLATTLAEENQLPLFMLLLLIGLMFWVFWMGGGWRTAEKDTAVIVEDALQAPTVVRQGAYLYIPIVHTVEAKLPTYPLMAEFDVGAIDTRTPRMQQIKKIRVRVSYEIVNFLACFRCAADIKERVKELEAHEKLRRDDPALWTRVLNEVMHSIIDDSIRDGVWSWAETVVNQPNLKLDMPSLANPVRFEHDPYALSLNRVNLAEKVLEEVSFRSQRWGLMVHRIVFENIELDPQIIERATRDKDRELSEARHKAALEAAAIREKGLAEAEVRATTITRIIEALINQQKITITDQMLYNIVRAAMYSDGQMIWSATMDKSAGTSVRAA